MSKILCTVVHRRDANNVGDLAAEPLQYFLKRDQYKIVDISHLYSKEIEWDKPIIVGGGGLIANQFFGEIIRDLIYSPDKNAMLEIANQYWQYCAAANKKIRDEFFTKIDALVAEYVHKIDNEKSARIIWGAGHNSDYQKKLKGHLDYPPYLRLYDLVGIRDYDQPYKWVPCASCMHPAFEKNYPIKNRVIWFEHKKQLLKSTDFGSYPIPRIINTGDNVGQTIEILGSAETIITNSYHGAYWGTLLKRKVIVVEPWSSKFNALKHKPYFLPKGEFWEDIVRHVPIYDNALKECKAATEQYWSSVKGYL